MGGNLNSSLSYLVATVSKCQIHVGDFFKLCSTLRYLKFTFEFEMLIMKFVICRGDFAVEYAGELIEHSTAEERENKYAMDVSKGCYMYYFKTNGKHYW